MKLLGKKINAFRSMYCVCVIAPLLFACVAKEHDIETTSALRFEDVLKTDFPANHRAIISAFQLPKNPSAENLMSSAQTLKYLGAVPLADTPNMIEEWTTRALAIQADIGEQYPPLRGRVKGPAYRKHLLAANTSERFNEVYYASELAQITMLTEQAGLELTISLNNKSVCKLESSKNIKHCSWMPLYTAPHELIISNNNALPTSYIIVSN